VRIFRRKEQEREAALARTAEVWGKMAAQAEDVPWIPGGWTSHPQVRAYMNRLISGDPDLEWLSWVKKQFLPNGVDLALSLGCGGGYTEREARRIGLCQRIEGIDVSEEALRTARRLAEKHGLSGMEYRRVNLEEVSLAPQRYDAVIAKASLHHLRNLERALAEVEKALRPRGWFLVNEYVGPSRFQWTDEQLQYVNELLAQLPERYRREGGPEGPIRQHVGRPDAARIEATDPSEAIRSAEILPLLEARFEIAARRDFGGTLLQTLLSGIVANFDPEKEEDRARLDLVIHGEETLLREKALPSDFVVVVARKRGG
jgi:SAM-dependent methyltransferase